MLKELFESAFYLTHSRKADSLLMLNEAAHQGTFSMCDPAACASCEHCRTNPEEKKNLIVHSSDEVHVLELAQVYALMVSNPDDNCDFMLESRGVPCVLEMTCSRQKYVEKSKRLHAMSQLYSTLCVLFAVPDIRAHMERAAKRYAIFSWKNTDLLEDDADGVERGFLPFTRFAEETYSIDNEQRFDFGFRFKEVRYPDTLDFDTLIKQ